MNVDYYLDFEIADCRYEIMINDIPYFRDGSGGSVATEVLINQFLWLDENELSINILPHQNSGFNYTTYFKASIIQRDENSEKILVQVDYRFDDTNPLPVVNAKGKFRVEVFDFAEAPWLACRIEKLEEATRDKIIRKYNAIYQLFRTGNLDGIMAEASIKDQYFIERYRSQPESRMAYIRQQFAEFLQQWKFTDIHYSQWIFKSYAGNRLFTFELSSFDSPVEFVEEIKNLRINIPIYLSLIDDEVKWVM